MTPCPESQRGALILGGVVLLLVLAMCVVTAAIRIGVGDQRSLSHEITRRQMLALAESGRARARAYLQQYPRVIRQTVGPGWLNAGSAHWSACASADVEWPCGDGTRNRYAADWSAYRNWSAAAVHSEQGDARVHLLARTAGLKADDTAPLLLSLVSQASSPDQQAHAVLLEDVLLTPLMRTLPAATILADQLRIAGDASLVGNPDGIPTNRALTLWSNGNVELLDTARTCTPTLLIDGACSFAGAISQAGKEGEDILDLDGGQGGVADSTVAMGDALERIFGLVSTQANRLKSVSRRIDCQQPSVPEPGAVWWSAGDCRLPVATVLGSASAPLILVVEGDFQAQGGGFNGLLVLLSAEASMPVLQLDDGFALSGALISNAGLQIQGNRYRIAYEPNILKRLMQSSAAPLLAVAVPGSWRDFP